MSHSRNRGWGYKLVSWIPGLGSSEASMAQNKFVPTEAFEHRYARRDALLDILQKPPFSFKEREIQIHVRLILRSFVITSESPRLLVLVLL
jgi:hypothetical protein